MKQKQEYRYDSYEARQHYAEEAAKDGDVQEKLAKTAVENTEVGERLKAEIDEILDEIDEVLETNAEEFIKSYVQQGGE